MCSKYPGGNRQCKIRSKQGTHFKRRGTTHFAQTVNNRQQGYRVIRTSRMDAGQVVRQLQKCLHQYLKYSLRLLHVSMQQIRDNLLHFNRQPVRTLQAYHLQRATGLVQISRAVLQTGCIVPIVGILLEERASLLENLAQFLAHPAQSIVVNCIIHNICS